MLPRTSPTKATSGVAIVSASRQSPLEGERPTTGSDEGNSFKGIACTEQPITRAHENWGSSPATPKASGRDTNVGTGHGSGLPAAGGSPQKLGRYTRTWYRGSILTQFQLTSDSFDGLTNNL
jgi:hypothetical protein